MTPGQAASYKATIAEIDGDPTALANLARKRRDAELRAYHVLGQIMQRVPAAIRIGVWAVNYTTIEVLLSAVANDHDARAKLMMFAEQFDLDYAETEQGHGKNMVSAYGLYNKVPVKFWYLVAPCTCGECGAAR